MKADEGPTLSVALSKANEKGSKKAVEKSCFEKCVMRNSTTAEIFLLSTFSF